MLMPSRGVGAGMDEAFFRQRYEADATNKSKQSWHEHHDWVQTFYKGKRFPPVSGWTDREKEILGKLPASAHAEVKPQLDATAKLLASEWAKDNSVRKVSTSDLQSWGKRFAEVAKDPQALLAALKQVESDIHARVK